MTGANLERGRRTLTPAVLGSALFVAACALAAITFVAARGGLQMPVAATLPPAAVASPRPVPSPSLPAPTPAPPVSAAPSPASSAPIPSATAAPPSTPPSPGPPTFDPNDPLAALPPCPGIHGCFEYVVQRGDTLSGVASRYVLPVSTVLALNPELADPSTIVVGQVLYLGRDPKLRLEACPGTVSCWLYVVRPGDLLSTIAGRYGVTIDAILAANPAITDVNKIYSGQVLRLLGAEG
ncbi:MAG TPA: LysM domain-containing protein [Candidatus Limnocylindria bacterium]|nr:LysM domain-containing protein [Candidatus Limnocylindria bacterium]